MKKVLDYTEIKRLIIERKKDVEKNISICRQKLDDNYCHAFLWNYHESLYVEIKVKQSIDNLLDFMEQEPDRTDEWLEHNIKVIENRLFHNNLTESSTSRGANIAHELTVKAEQELRIFYIDLLKQLA
jgi:hypothetical protein